MTIDLPRLRKVHALTGSPNPHEAAVAWGKVDAILARAGKTRADLPVMMEGISSRSSLPPGWTDLDASDLKRRVAEMMARHAAPPSRRQRSTASRPRKPRVPFLQGHPDVEFLHARADELDRNARAILYTKGVPSSGYAEMHLAAIRLIRARLEGRQAAKG